MAHAAGDRAVRLPHLHDQLWAARHAWLLSHADVAGQRLEPRRVWPSAGDSEHPLGHRPTVCRRHRRPLRHRARIVGRRHILRRWPDPDGVLDVAWDARPRGRRLHRLRPSRLFLLRRARRVRQAFARALALACLRRRHGRRLVRSVPLFSARGLADGRVRVADRAAELRHRHAAGAAAVACACDGSRRKLAGRPSRWRGRWRTVMGQRRFSASGRSSTRSASPPWPTRSRRECSISPPAR
jgi:hypothetical protein